MVQPNADKKAIVEQCILGMNNPNRIMDVSYDESLPAIVREMTDDDAVIAMVDANIQREELLPSEKEYEND